jgi:hypothetical protein
LVPGLLNCGSQPHVDTTSIRNHEDAGNSGDPQCSDQASNDAALFRDGEDSPLRDQAPDVTPRRWVGYDSDNIFAGGRDLRGILALTHSPLQKDAGTINSNRISENRCIALLSPATKRQRPNRVNSFLPRRAPSPQN